MSKAKKAESTAKPKDKRASTSKPAPLPKGPPVSSYPDWECIELDYRAGIKTLRQIATEQGVAHGTITKRARKNGWERDLSAKIQQKADALVSKAAVSTLASTATKAAEREVVEANAQAIADVILGHRHDIRRSMKLVTALTDSLESMSKPETQELLEQLGVLMFKPDDKGVDKLNEMYQYIISLPSMIKMIKLLSQTLRILIDAQRKSFGVDDKFNPNADANNPGGLGFTPTRSLSDAERAVRLSKLLNSNRALLNEMTAAQE